MMMMMMMYLSSAEADHQVRDEGVLGLPGAMADHHAPAAALSQLTPESRSSESAPEHLAQRNSAALGFLRLDGLGDGADLVHFEQQAVAGLLLHGLLDPLWVGDSQVISYDLGGAQTGES